MDENLANMKALLEQQQQPQALPIPPPVTIPPPKVNVNNLR